MTGNTFDLTRNVTFNPDYDLSPYNKYAGVINFQNGMLINKSITFDGKGYTISGLNQARIFTITESNVNLINTNFINASSSTNGGALYLNEGVTDLTVSGCLFENNHADAYGGAIYQGGQGNNIKITDTAFNKNTAADG